MRQSSTSIVKHSPLKKWKQRNDHSLIAQRCFESLRTSRNALASHCSLSDQHTWTDTPATESTSTSPSICVQRSMSTFSAFKRFSLCSSFENLYFITGSTKYKYKQYNNRTRWMYCVECPQYSTRRRSASNIHRSGMLRKDR